MDERKVWAPCIEGAIEDATRSCVPLRNRVARPVVVLATAPSLAAVAAVLRDETAVVGRESLDAARFRFPETHSRMNAEARGNGSKGRLQRFRSARRLPSRPFRWPLPSRAAGLTSRTRPGHAGDPRGVLDLAARAHRCRARRWEKSPLAFRAVVGEYRESGLRRSERRDVTVAVERTSIVVSVVFLCLVALAELAGVAHAERPAANPPGPPISADAEGSFDTLHNERAGVVGVGHPYAECASSEGHSVSRDLVDIPSGQAKALLRVFFPRVPAYSVGRIAGAPKGFACRGAAMVCPRTACTWVAAYVSHPRR